MSGTEKIGLVFMIIAAPHISDGWNGLIFTAFALFGALMFVIPQRKP